MMPLRFSSFIVFMLMREKSIEGLAQEFEAFMRSLDPSDAPSLFGSGGTNPMIEQILRFVRGYNVIIAREARDLQGLTGGKWILDLTGSAIHSHLAAWGQRHPLLEVVCDDSKPLRALAASFDVMVNRPDTVSVEMFGKSRALTWNMSKPIAFASSAGHSGVQVADLLAGVTAAIPLGGPEMAELGAKVQNHLHDDCVLPDFGILKLDQEEAAVNWLVLEDLADRADNGLDPLDNMDLVFEYGRQSFPDFRANQLAKAGRNRGRS